LTEVQPPEDEQQRSEPTGEDVPAETAEETPAETAEETPGETAEETPAETPVAEETPAPAAPAAPTLEAAQAPAQDTPATPASEAAVPTGQADDAESADVAPRQRPEIPGADLVPDIVSESNDFLDAETRAAAEADAELAALAGDDDSSHESQPIADAAIDLGAGARYAATGKRKTAVARVIIKPGTGAYTINGKTLDVFFPRATLQRVIRQPLETVGYDSRMDVVARMHGGGVAAQAGALRHGISRALIDADPNLRGELKRRGFLTRDPRVKERKKAGLKKARKRPQFSKR
jgi:small subunit ribosomal protein S9